MIELFYYLQTVVNHKCNRRIRGKVDLLSKMLGVWLRCHLLIMQTNFIYNILVNINEHSTEKMEKKPRTGM